MFTNERDPVCRVALYIYLPRIEATTCALPSETRTGWTMPVENVILTMADQYRSVQTVPQARLGWPSVLQLIRMHPFLATAMGSIAWFVLAVSTVLTR